MLLETGAIIASGLLGVLGAVVLAVLLLAVGTGLMALYELLRSKEGRKCIR